MKLYRIDVLFKRQPGKPQEKYALTHKVSVITVMSVVSCVCMNLYRREKETDSRWETQGGKDERRTETRPGRPAESKRTGLTNFTRFEMFLFPSVLTPGDSVVLSSTIPQACVTRVCVRLV